MAKVYNRDTPYPKTQPKPITTEESETVDPTHDAILESMRRQARSSFVLKRHDDLRKQCEKEVSTYDKAKRLTALQCRRSQIPHLNRMKTLLRCSSPEKRHSQTSPNDVTARDRRHIRVSVYGDGAVVADRDSAQSESPDFERLLALAPTHDDVNGTDPRHSPASCGDVTGGFPRIHGSGRRGRRSTSSPVVNYNCLSSFTGRERFLFRVLWQNGKHVYIRDEAEAQRSRRLLNGISCDDISRAISSQRTGSVRP